MHDLVQPHMLDPCAFDLVLTLLAAIGIMAATLYLNRHHAVFLANRPIYQHHVQPEILLAGLALVFATLLSVSFDGRVRLDRPLHIAPASEACISELLQEL